MTEYLPDGRRRIDHVLDPAYLADIAQLSSSRLRTKLQHAEAEEAQLAAIRAVLNERLTLIEVEQQKRAGEEKPLPEQHPLAHHRRNPARRKVERLLDDVSLTDISSRTDDELIRVAHTFASEEAHLREVYDRVAAVVRRCAVELADRTAEPLPKAPHPEVRDS